MGGISWQAAARGIYSEGYAAGGHSGAMQGLFFKFDKKSSFSEYLQGALRSEHWKY